MKYLLMALVLGIVAGARPARAADAKALDGKAYVGQVCPKGKTTGEADTLTFKDGQFRSMSCDKYGFGSAAYSSTPDGKAIRFTSTTRGKHGTIVWEGKAEGEDIEGTMTFHRQKKWYTFFLPATEESDFKGSLQK
jgi:hypothetical protein